MVYSGVALTPPYVRRTSPADEALVDSFAKGGIGAYRIHNQRFARLREVVLWKAKAGSDPTWEESRKPLLPSSDAGEVSRVHPQPAAEFTETHPLFGQESGECVAERLVGSILRHRCSF